MISVREAKQQDINQLVLLCEALHRESDVYQLQPFLADQLAVKIAHGMSFQHNLVLIAEDDSGVIGYFMGGITEGFINHQRTAFDYSVYVLPNKRNGRVAIKLFKAFEAWAIDNNASYFRVGITTDIHTEKTSKFYQCLGFKQAGVSFEKVLKNGR